MVDMMLKNDDACNASLDDYELGDNNGLKLDVFR